MPRRAADDRVRLLHGPYRAPRPDAAAAEQTGAGALADGPALDLSPEIVAERLLELEGLDGRLFLVLARLADAVDPVGACR
jgi:hypothetical protein